MSVFRQIGGNKIAIGFVLAALCGAVALAQESDDDAADENEDIEEITVVARKPGDRRRVDQEYEDPLRAKLLKDFYEMKKDQEEFEWRKSAAADSSSTISWGYDPTDEYRMRNELDAQALPSQRTQPASLIRIGFGK